MPDLVVPAMGESITEAVISRWHKKVGDRVEADEPVLALETDKITMDVPAPAAGALAEQRFAEGATVKVGDVVGTISAGAKEAAPAKAEAKPAEAKPAEAKEPAATSAEKAEARPAPAKAEAKEPAEAKPEPARTEAGKSPPPRGPAPRAAEPAREPAREAGRDNGDSRSHAQAGRRLSPSMRRAMREEGGGQEAGHAAETAETEAAETTKTPAPARAPEKARAPAEPSRAPARPADPREEIVPMTPIRKRIAQRLLEAQQSAAALTTFNEVDMTRVMALRDRFKQEFADRHGIKLGFMSFFVKAAIAALELYPGLNAEVRGDSIVYKKFYDLGIAVSTERGLVVPVLRGADQLGFAAIEQGIAELATRARNGKLSLDDLVGATFSITNGGIYGSMMSTPMLNYPQTGILGMHNIVERPTAVGKSIELRPIMYVAMTYDHRVVDGREAVSFLVAIKQRIEDPDRLMFEL